MLIDITTVYDFLDPLVIAANEVEKQFEIDFNLRFWTKQVS